MSYTTTQIAELRAGMDACRVPEHLQEGLEHHCLAGRPNGGFLTACLENDLLGAVSRADDQSLAGLRGVAKFLYGYAPTGSWGTPSKVRTWRERGGLAGAQA